MDSLVSYIETMHAQLYKQRKKLKELTLEVEEMKRSIEELQKKPAMSAEKIEYKFDQLKIETLEGTLNIGWSPGAVSMDDDLGIPVGEKVITSSPPNQWQMRADQYLDQHWDHLMSTREQTTGMTCDSEVSDWMKNEIRCHIHDRIPFLLETNPEYRNPDKEEAFSQHLQHEIHHLFDLYMTQIPPTSNKGESS